MKLRTFKGWQRVDACTDVRFIDGRANKVATRRRSFDRALDDAAEFVGAPLTPVGEWYKGARGFWFVDVDVDVDDQPLSATADPCGEPHAR